MVISISLLTFYLLCCRQAAIIGILKATGVLKQGVWQNYDVDDVAQGLQVRACHDEGMGTRMIP